MSDLRCVLPSGHAVALLEGGGTTLLWASSFVLVKLALANGFGPLTIAGLRYTLACVLLLPLLRWARLRGLPPSLWIRLLLMGVCGYALANGAFFWSLQRLPAATASLMMGFIPLLSLVAGILWLREVPGRYQAAGAAIALTGTALFLSQGAWGGAPQELAVMCAGIVCFALYGLLGREIARDRLLDTVTLTALPLGLGGGAVLVAGVTLEGPPLGNPTGWAVVGALAVFNTALAYLLYNHALRHLTILEMQVLLNLSPLFTALLGWAVLGESFGPVELVGMGVAVVGVTLVQARREAA